MSDYKILKSYSKVWRIERIFYEFAGFNLPYPLAFTTVIYFIVFTVAMFILSRLPLINLVPNTYKYLFIPAGLAYLCSDKLLDGKNPLSFIKSILVHWFVVFTKGNRVNRYRYFKPQNKKRAVFINNISYRVLDKIH